MSNLRTIQAIYGALGKGDVPAILEHIREDVALDAELAPAIPLGSPARGRAGFTGFFGAMHEHMEITHFASTALLEGSGVVVALIDIAFRVKMTGRVVRGSNEIHVWRFDEKGRVSSMKYGVNSHAHFRAFSDPA